MAFSIQSVIERVTMGITGKIENLQFNLEGNELWISGISIFSNTKFLSKSYAFHELQALKEELLEICVLYPDFAKFSYDKVKIFQVVIDDNGKLFLPVCQEKDGIITWFYPYK